MRVALLSTLLLLSACDDDDQQIVIDMAVVDSAIPDLTWAMVNCGGGPCVGNQPLCCINRVGESAQGMCVALTDCDDGGTKALCDGPDDCGGGVMVCCAHVVTEMRGDKYVPLSGSVGCSATCEGKVELSTGKQNLTTRLCRTPADCAGFMGSILGGDPTPFDGCCKRDGEDQQFCATRDPTFAMIAKYTCQP